MNRLRPLLITVGLTVAALLAATPTGAGDNAVLGKAELQQVFADLLTGHAALPKEDLEISHFTASPETIALPPGPPDFRVISKTQAKELGRQTIVAAVLVNGVARARVTLSGDVALHGDAVCAARALARRHVITAADLVRVRRNLALLGPDLITDEATVIGKEIKTTMQPGAVLYGHFIKEPEMVKRGDIVSILAITDALTITVPGRVQNAGAKGDLIKVKNLMSRKEIYAKVTGPDTVQAQF